MTDFFFNFGLVKDHGTICFGTSLDDFDLHPRSQLSEKSKTSALIFSKNFHRF